MKKTLAILCLAALCLGTSVGCGKNDTPAEETQNGSMGTTELGSDGVSEKEDGSESAPGAHEHTYVDDRCTICQQPMPSDGLEFILNDNEISYSVFAGLCKSSNVVIPDTYEGLPVTHIGADAFGGHQELTGIYIPDSVTRIGSSAFYHCINLTDVRIGNSVTSIGDHAFRDCRALTSISLPDSLTSIGDRAFAECPDLMETEGGVQYLDTWVFGCDESVTEAVLRPGTRKINNRAFVNCKNLTSVMIPDGVTHIQALAFFGCSGLTSITISDNLTSIGKSAFSGCTALTSICLPDSVTSIGDSAFSDCTGLANITISDNLTSIGESAFSCCTALTSIRIPDSLESIGTGAFFACDSLTYTEYNNGKYLGNEGNPYICLMDLIDPTVAAFSMSGKTKFICSEAFHQCYRLTGITIPDGVTYIGEGAFAFCRALEKITIPNSVTSIGEGAFSYCGNLTVVTIPNSVISIDKYVFSECESLTSIVYTGTIAEWKAIKKGKNWGNTISAYTITCTDGTISKDGTVTPNT